MRVCVCVRAYICVCVCAYMRVCEYAQPHLVFHGYSKLKVHQGLRSCLTQQQGHVLCKGKGACMCVYYSCAGYAVSYWTTQRSSRATFCAKGVFVCVSVRVCACVCVCVCVCTIRE
jgi:hypothetical protein